MATQPQTRQHLQDDFDDDDEFVAVDDGVMGPPDPAQSQPSQSFPPDPMGTPDPSGRRRGGEEGPMSPSRAPNRRIIDAEIDRRVDRTVQNAERAALLEERRDARTAQGIMRQFRRRGLTRPEREARLREINAHLAIQGRQPIDPQMVGLPAGRRGGTVTVAGQEGRPETLDPLQMDQEQWTHEATPGDIDRVIAVARESGDQSVASQLAQIDSAIQSMGASGLRTEEQREALGELRRERAAVAWRYAQTDGFAAFRSASSSRDLFRRHGPNSPFQMPDGSTAMFDNNGRFIPIAGPPQQAQEPRPATAQLQRQHEMLGLSMGGVARVPDEMRGTEFPPHWEWVESDPRTGALKPVQMPKEEAERGEGRIVERDGVAWTVDSSGRETLAPLDFQPTVQGRREAMAAQNAEIREAEQRRRLAFDAYRDADRRVNTLVANPVALHQEMVRIGLREPLATNRRGRTIGTPEPPTDDEMESLMDAYMRESIQMRERAAAMVQHNTVPDGRPASNANAPRSQPQATPLSVFAFHPIVEDMMDIGGHHVPYAPLSDGTRRVLVPDIGRDEAVMLGTDGSWRTGEAAIVDGRVIPDMSVFNAN